MTDYSSKEDVCEVVVLGWPGFCPQGSLQDNAWAISILGLR